MFEDPGFDAWEAEYLKLRAKLMQELEKLIRDSGLTQNDVAEVLGIQQSRVRDLVRGSESEEINRDHKVADFPVTGFGSMNG